MQTLAEIRLLDAAQQVLYQPEASYRWHRFHDAYRDEAIAHLRAAVAQELSDNLPTDGLPGFFWAQFMAATHARVSDATSAGTRLLACRPVDAERIIAFVLQEWSHILARSENLHQGMIARRIPELLALLADTVPLADPQVKIGKMAAPSPLPPLRRVAVVVPLAGSHTHPPTRLALKQLALLHQAGIEVALCSAQELHVMDREMQLATRTELALPEQNLDGELPPGCVLMISSTEFSLRRRRRDMAAAITRFAPDAVLFVGLFSPLISLLYPHFPVLGLCIHAVAPLAPVDAWLCSDDSRSNRFAHDWGTAFPPAWGHPHPWRVQRSALVPPLTRTQAGLAEHATVLMVIGARLHQEIAGEWAARLQRLLRARPNCVLLAVGGTGECPPALAELPAENVRCIAHQHALRAWLPLADVVLNPARAGGGFSIAEAMAEGLPVLSLRNGDGGDKLGPWASNDLTDYFSELERLLDDPLARQTRGQALAERFAQRLDLDQSLPSLLDGLTCARRLAAARGINGVRLV